MVDCEGTPDGSAVVDACGLCTGGNTNRAPCPSVALAAVADSYVETNSPDANHGTEGAVDVNNTAVNPINPSRVFLRFDLGQLPAGAIVKGATLQMTSITGYAWGGDGNVYSYLVADDTWSETGITWTNQPAADTSGALGFWWLWNDGTLPDQVGSFSTPELGQAVANEQAGDGLISLMLTSPGYDSSYSSREGSDPAKAPALIVSYVVPTETVLEPVADTYADGYNALSNFGTADNLEVNPYGPAQTFLKFDLSSLPFQATITGVTLQATASTGYAYGGDGNVYAYLVSDDTWDENALTAGNAPAADTSNNLGSWWLWNDGSIPDEVGTNSAPALKAAVETEYAGDKTISLMLTSPGYYTSYYSRETADAAKHPLLKVSAY